jgi:predicted DNA-binding WGR domain protein/outer membrane protein assembly factor BamB
MADPETTYLELSEGKGGAHKFYEVAVHGKTVTIRFGRIGASGQTLTTTYLTPAHAGKEAAQKIAEKLRKDYQPVTREVEEEGEPEPVAAPALWIFSWGHEEAKALYADSAGCWVANEAGQVFELDHQGAVKHHFQLPDEVGCLLGEGGRILACCQDGCLYDLSSKVPAVCYTWEDECGIAWLDSCDGIRALLDSEGTVAAIGPEGEVLWKRKGQSYTSLMVGCDRRAVYHWWLDSKVSAYDLATGKPLCQRRLDANVDVLCGCQTDTAIYAGVRANKLYRLDKQRGEKEVVYACDDEVLACAVTADGERVFVADNAQGLYGFTGAGERLWKMDLAGVIPFLLQLRGDRLFGTDMEVLLCLDVSAAAIQAAQAGRAPRMRKIKAPRRRAIAPHGI